MNVTINDGARFMTSIRANTQRYPFVLGNMIEVQLPYGTLVTYRGEVYSIGNPVFEIGDGGARVRRVVAPPAHPRHVTLDAGTEYSVFEDEFGLLKAIERRQTFVFQNGTSVVLPAGTCLHNEYAHIELKEAHEVVLN